jgi:hypothetical protein
MPSRIAIIGGGPSAGQRDLGRLGETLCVAVVNDGFRKLPWADICITADGWWFQKRAKELRGFGGRIVAILPGHVRDVPLRYERVQRLKGAGVSRDPQAAYFADNSGFAALSWAAANGYRQIALIGFDLNPSGGHWHEGYEWGKNRFGPAHFARWASAFDAVGPEYAAIGMDIVNTNPASAVKAFRFASFEDVVSGRAWEAS